MLLPLLAIWVLAAAASAAAIDLPSSLTRKLLGNPDKDTPAGEFDAEAMDNSVDPDQYVVGGGDGFQISLVGLPSHEYNVTVNSDGNLFIGDFGEIVLGRMTLRQAVKVIQDRVHAALGKRYPVYVALKRCKRAHLVVSGGLLSPGSYSLPGTSRILDAIKAANLGKMPSPEEFDLRRVELRNRDSAWTLDLFRYLVLKDASQNPFVYPGDNVEVHYLDRSVTVAGEVFPPMAGRVPIRPGETLGDLLPMLRFRGTADSTRFLVRRAGEGTRSLGRDGAAGFDLRDGDVIAVPGGARQETRDTVRVTGEVARAGTFPVSWGRTTAKEALEWAGGAGPDADPGRAVVIRTNRLPLQPLGKEGQPLPPYPVTGLRAPQVTAYATRPEINTSLNNLMATHDYAVIRLGDDPGSVLLEGGDELHVPRKEQYVYLSGHVRRPGAYPYAEGRDADWYVGKAGGYSSKADRGNRIVMTRYTDEVMQFKDVAGVERGDVIVVPAEVEHKKLSAIYLPVTQALISLLSLAITIIVVTR